MARKRKPAPKSDPSSEEEEEQPQEDVPEEEDDDDEDEYEDDEDDEDDEEAGGDEDDEEEDEEEANDEDLNPTIRDSIRKLLEPFGKDQLVELLRDAALADPSLLRRLSSAAESDPAHRKIFVHGLGWDATSDVLAAAFRRYGEIDECKVVADKVTGKSKGYGFILFRTRAAARKALKEPQKKIGNRMTHCQLASAGPPGAHGPAPDATGRKLFVSGVGDNISMERLRAFFAKFGEIEEGPLGYDRTTGKLRGFAIFVYKNAEGCKKALEEPRKVFDGCELQCQKAVEGLKPRAPATAAVPAMLQPNDLALTYASQSVLGMNPVAGFVGQGLNHAVGLMGQNVGVGGLLNPGPAAGVSPALSRAGTTPPQYGVGLGISGGGAGVNTISPSVMGTYGSQVALQGLGAYQSSQLPSTTVMPMRSQTGIGSLGSGLPPYLGR